MAKFDIYALIAVQVEAENSLDAQQEAEQLPVEYWDADSLLVTEVVARAD